MPIGLTRLNERRHRPNQNITFIKPLKGPDEEISQDILERVAAIVWPIMKSEGLGVMTLNEHEANLEFWGRNWNAGEVIELVLKSPTTGRWLPFPFVCKVMIHELAHIKQMNHSRAFMAVRDGFQKQLNVLTARGYSGEGFWSRGQSLSTDYTSNRVLDDSELPKNLCGGTYRRANKLGTKRKLTYAEQKNKRKEKLFGKSEGDSLGASEKERLALEKGKGKTSKASSVKPRVAQSQRGRDLRAEAAQKRMEAMQKEASTSKAKKEESPDEEDEDEYTTDEEDTVDVGGGNRLVKVEDGGNDEEDWQELQDEMKLSCATASGETRGAGTSTSTSGDKGKEKQKKPLFRKDESETEDSDLEIVAGPAEKQTVESAKKPSPTLSSFISKKQSSATPPRARPSTSAIPVKQAKAKKEEDGTPRPLKDAARPVAQKEPSLRTCGGCTAENSLGEPLCQVCANVLDRSRTPNWKCNSASCAGGVYANPMDAGVCGCCGSRKS